jgi:hypothetical protein
MEKNTLKLLGAELRQQLPMPDTKHSKKLRRLIVELERRQRELDCQRNDRGTSKPH